MNSFTITLGNASTQTHWQEAQRATWQDLVILLTDHKVGSKDGPCFIPGEIEGSRRKKEQMRKLSLVVLDLDSGNKLEEIKAALKRECLRAIIYSTHSHLATRTTVSKELYDKAVAECPISMPGMFLREKLGLAFDIVKDAKIISQTEKEIIIEHAPVEKYRVVIPLKAPWLASDYPSQEEALSALKRFYHAVGELLGVKIDPSCTDASRLFYLPRHPEGTEFVAEVVEGDPLDLSRLEIKPQPAKPAVKALPFSGKPEWSKDDVIGMLSRIHPDSLIYDEWLRVGMALNEAGYSVEIWDWWSSKGIKYKDKRDLENRWKDFSPSGGVTIATLVYMAQQNGWKPERKSFSKSFKTKEDATNGLEESVPPEFSDLALAEKLVDVNGNNLLYCAAWGKWMIWDGKTWQDDLTLKIFDYSRNTCKEAAAELEARDHNARSGAAKKVASAQTVYAVEKLARSDRRVAATTDQWDSDFWILNTPGGIVDLKTGEIKHHNRNFYCTKITAVAPHGECQQWFAFLDQVTAGDKELQKFLQRFAGYALTGETKEHALPFAYGTGGNGKGVFVNTLTGIMRNYATVASMDTFTASQSDRHPTDLAMLRGARLVTAQETEEGRRWAESKIKAMTGGDPITARFMRQDFFTFQPQFKLLIAGNHKPGLRNVDQAIRRRFYLIPFTVTIPPDKADKALPEKLKAEWPGILQWMIEGCLEWQRIGLQPPASVRAATDEYLESEDAIGAWLDENTDRKPECYENTTDLYQSWNAWAQAAGEFPGSLKAFSHKMASKGFHKGEGRRRRDFIGISLKRQGYPE